MIRIRRRPIPLVLAANTEKTKNTETGMARRLKNLRPPWKKGQSGNKAGRPKLLTRSLNLMLKELIPVTAEIDGKKIEFKIPRHELIARTQCEIASSFTNRNAVNAAKLILEVTEPKQIDDTGNVDKSLVREMLELLFARRVTGSEANLTHPGQDQRPAFTNC
jgi:hypothetical protein